MANLVLCSKCGNGRYSNIKRVTTRFAKCFVCSRCGETMEGMVNLIKLCDKVETENGFVYLQDRLNTSDGCKAGTLQ